jgi:ferric-dicitrate binding protein FerR (iron transport regulator)
MKKRSSLDDNLLVRALCGEASKEEIFVLKHWIDESEKNKLAFHQIQDTWNASRVAHAIGPDEMAHDWSRIERRILNDKTEVKQVVTRARTGGFRSLWWKAAAIFLIGFALSWYLFKGAPMPLAGTNELNIVSTPMGSQSTIQLPDGSVVVMNAGSKLTYPQNFQRGNRQVHLEGEAFFRVAHQKKGQFTVNTDDLSVRVFGTTFNIKAYPDEPTVETTLIEGKISVVRPGDERPRNKNELAMSPNQRLVLYKGSGVIRREEEVIQKLEKVEDIPVKKDRLILSRNIQTEKFTSWKDGQLIIESEPMEKLAVKLERKYNVRFHYEDDSIRSVRFTGMIEDETIEQVMAAMALASPLRYQVEDRDIWIGIDDRIREE